MSSIETPPSTIQPSPSAPGAEGSRLAGVLRLVGIESRVPDKVRQSAQTALSAIPADEPVIDAWRCGILVGATKNEGVAVLTGDRLSVFDRRGIRSIDQGFHLALATQFSIVPGPSGSQVTIAATGARPVTIDLVDIAKAEAFRHQIMVQKSAREEGWWSQASIAWPGWLGAEPTWSYLGGARSMPGPAEELRVQVGPAGVILADVEGTTAPLTSWSAVSFLHVLPPDEGLERAASRGLLVSEAFGPVWRASEWMAFLLVGYASGEQVFLGTSSLTESDLRARLFRVADAMPAPPGPEDAETAAGAGASEPAAATAPAPPPEPEPAVTPVAETPAAPEPVAETPPAQPPAAPDAAAPYDLATQLERLGALRREGILDEDEFTKAKAALLGG
ncbi:MAG TPA: SHOCT domain-containing protein [Acidimicrobiia bacterium]|nr:SHOCT domain-containing protein [Acidimicrobiia bacterium]